ncbi:alkaline phosphatase family protein [Streptomyces sp. NPDC001401]|uniref:alkaline phosphatase family protein n=1 Tax=Streptomyces sp. NPDC001401 TaxID=3364570 RepID=UPI003683C0D2
MPDDAGQLGAIEHLVVLMLENCSFDHMLGWLCADEGSVSPSKQPYEGLTGAESNPDGRGGNVTVFRTDGTAPHAYFMPGADPGEGYAPTDRQLFGTSTPGTPTPTATNDGFAADYADTLVANTATSQGHMDDATHTFTTPSVFGRLSEHGIDWTVYGYAKQPLTRGNFPDTVHAPASHFGLFTDFRAVAAGGTLPAFTFLEPSWRSTGNSQHPNYDVALGEQLIHDVYRALRDGPAWASTLLITYDDVLVSPLIEPGTVFRVADGSTPLDHTSVLKTVEQHWNLPSLTARDAAAPGIGAVLTRTEARTDDPLAGVTVPLSSGTNPARHEVSHLDQVHAALVARDLIPRT